MMPFFPLSSSLPFLSLFPFYLKSREKRRQSTLTTGSLSKWTQWLGLGQAEDRSLHKGLHGVVGVNLPLPSGYMKGSGSLSGAAGTRTRAPRWDAEVASSGITSCSSKLVPSCCLLILDSMNFLKLLHGPEQKRFWHLLEKPVMSCLCLPESHE